MARIIPKRRLFFISAAVIGIILYAVFVYAVFPASPCTDNDSTADSNAKLVHTNILSYLEKCGDNGTENVSGVFYGSLCYPISEKNLYGTEYDFDGSEEDILKYMRSLMGGSERSEIEYGYYFTIIRNSMPVQSCWCKDERLLYTENEILSQYENGISANLLYSDGTHIGQYPDSGSDEFKYITPSLPFHTALKHIAKKHIYLLPPVILIAVSAVIYGIFFAKKNYRRIKTENG